jgi:spore maturation protein CgeB
MGLSRNEILMKVACILDEFSYRSFISECNLHQVNSNDWQSFFEDFDPDFLFVESGWFSSGGSWFKKISNYSTELEKILEYFKKNNKPTVFWNKEDPVHFDKFLNTASHFDYIFTTDINCISKYKFYLGHNRIYLLPFASQPAIFGPSENFSRKKGIAFAGSYYKKYKDRVVDMDNLFTSLDKLVDIDIFDRYFDATDSNYKFPDKYLKFIKGTLAFDQILKAYKGYIYGLNFNTIKSSESMFARRSLELLGSGTVVISNYSKAFPLLFGDIIIASDDPAVIQSRFTEVAQNDLLRSKLALAGVRKVMLEHTYAHRLARIMDKALGVVEYPALPPVLVLLAVNGKYEFTRFIDLLSAQTFDNWNAIFLVHSDRLKAELDSSALDARIQAVLASSLGETTVTDLAKETPWIALLHPSDYYGPNYLLDLVLATRYSKSSAFGKKQFFEVASGEVALQGADGAYRPMTTMELRSSLISVGYFSELSISHLFSNDSISSIEVSDGMSLDYLSYCRNVFNQNVVSIEAVSKVVDDLEINQGSSIDELYAKADALKMSMPFWLGKPGWKPEKLAQIFGDRFTRDITGSIDRFGWHIISELSDGDTCDLFSEFAIPIGDLGWQSGTPFYMEAGVGLQMQLLVRFEESSGALVEEALFELNAQNQLIPPITCTHVRLGYRITSSGSSRITRLVLA